MRDDLHHCPRHLRIGTQEAAHCLLAKVGIPAFIAHRATKERKATLERDRRRPDGP